MRGGVAIGQQDVRRKLQGPFGRRLNPGGVAGAPLKIDLEIAADGPAGLFELAAEGVGPQPSLRIVLGIQDDDANPPLGLLACSAKG